MLIAEAYWANPEPMKVNSCLPAALGEPKEGSLAIGGVLFPFSSSCSCPSDRARR